MKNVLNCLFVLIVIVVTSIPALSNNTADRRIRLLILGDSLVAGYGLPIEDSFPAQLNNTLKQRGYDVQVINAGVSGDTTAGGLSRVNWALADEPELVIVELGANDALRGLDIKNTYNNLDNLLQTLKQNDVQVILAGMQAPASMGREYVDSFNQIYPELATKHNVTLYPFFLSGVALIPDLNQSDGIHPNAEGVRVIVENILPVVFSELKRIH